MFLGDHIQNWIIIEGQWRSSNKKLYEPHTLKPSEITGNEDAHSCSRRPRDVRCGSSQSRVDSR